VTDTNRRPPLYTPHRRALTVLYADLESYALQQREVFIGTAGSVIERKNAAGFRFYAHQFYDGEGKKRERYLAAWSRISRPSPGRRGSTWCARTRTAPAIACCAASRSSPRSRGGSAPGLGGCCATSALEAFRSTPRARRRWNRGDARAAETARGRACRRGRRSSRRRRRRMRGVRSSLRSLRVQEHFDLCDRTLTVFQPRK